MEEPLVVPYIFLKKIFKRNHIRELVSKNDTDPIFFRSDIKIEPFSQFMENSSSVFSMGAFSYSYSPFSVNRHITVGRYCSLSSEVTIMLGQHPIDWISSAAVMYNGGNMLADAFKAMRKDFPGVKVPEFDPWRCDPVYIGNDVWIGQNVKIKPGVTIGNGAVVGTNSLVLHDVEPFTVVGGTPARVIKVRFNQKLIDRINELEWWRYNVVDFYDLQINKPENFLDALEKRIAAREIKEYKPQAVTARELCNEIKKLRVQ